jgi:hypothetical protein
MEALRRVGKHIGRCTQDWRLATHQHIAPFTVILAPEGLKSGDLAQLPTPPEYVLAQVLLPSCKKYFGAKLLDGRKALASSVDAQVSDLYKCAAALASYFLAPMLRTVQRRSALPVLFCFRPKVEYMTCD